MAIKKIKIGNEEHDLQTTIANIDGLQNTLDNKIDKVSGKGLSTNDFTSAEKEKLASIEEGAKKMVWETY